MKFPAMPECTNCGECCGPVTARPEEHAKIEAFMERRGIKWVEHADALTCGFYQGGLCRIYPVRPAACRMYGVVKEMACPYFPEAVRLSFPPKAAIRSGLMNLNDKLLCESFAPDRGVRVVEALRAAVEEIT